jgi:carboxylesterase type B
VPDGAEIVYVMDTGDFYEGTKSVFTNDDRDYAQRVSEYFLEFARSGEPASKGSPAWPNDRIGQDMTMLFGESIVVQPKFMKPRLSTFIGTLKILGPLLKRR